MAKSKKRSKGPQQPETPDPARDAAPPPATDDLTAEVEALTGSGAWDKLATLYETRIRQAEGPAETLLLASRAAELYLDRLSSPRKAEEMAWLALGLDGAARAPFDLLVRLYDASKNRRKAAYLLFHRASALPPGPERSRLYYDLGVLWRDALGQKLRALTFFKAAITAGHGLDAVHAADAICAELGLYEESARLLKIEETLSQDQMLLANRFLDLGLKLAENPLLHDEARIYLRKALELKPQSKAAKRALTSLDSFFEAYEEAIDALRQEAVDTRDRGRAANLYRYIAEAYHQIGGAEGVKRAREYLDRSLMLDPASAPSIVLLGKLLVRDNDISPLVAELEKKAAEIRSNRTGSDIYFRIGCLHFEKGGDPGKAEAAWRRSVEMNPDNREARRFLADFLAERGNPDEAAAQLEAVLKVAGDPLDDAVIHFQLAEHASAKGDPGGAAIHAMSALDNLPPSGAALARLAEFLEKSGDQAGLAATLSSLSAFEADPEERFALVLRAAELYRELGSLEQAFALFRIALGLEPHRRPLHEALEALAEGGVGWKRLAEVYADEAGKHPGDERLLPVFKKLAWIFAEKLNEPARAADFLKMVLAADEEDADAARELSRIMTSIGDASQLVEALRREVHVARRAGEKVATLRRLAAIQEERLSDLEGAADTCREILALDRSDIDTLDRLCALYGRAGRFDDLRQLYVAEIARAAHAREKNMLRFKLAVLLGEQLGQPDEAVGVIEQILESDDGAVEAITLLESFAAKGLAPARAAVILAPRYRDKGEWRKYIECLERRCQAAPDPAARFALLREIGRVYEELLAQKDMAFATFCRALREVPADGDNRAALERLAAETRGWEELCLLYTEESRRDGVADDVRAAMLRTVAQVQEQTLEDLPAAAETITRLVEIVPGDEAAVRALVVIHRRIGNSHGLAGAMLRLSSMVAPVEERKELLHEAARIYEAELRDDDGAAKVFAKLFDVDERDATTLRKLDRLYEKLGNFEGLADILEREVALSQEPVEKADLLYRLGRTWQEPLKGAEVAVEFYARAINENPGLLGALGALEALGADPAVGPKVVPILEGFYRDRGEWGKLVGVVEKKLEAATGDDRRPLFDDLIATYETRMNHKQMAFAAACRAFREFPLEEAARATLTRLAVAGGFHEELAGVYEELAESPGLPAERVVALLTGAAAVTEEHLHDPLRALEIHTRILAADPQNRTALNALERLQKAAGNYQQLVAVYQQRLTLARGAEEKKALYFEMASVLEEKLNDLRGAKQAYLRVLELDPSDLVSLRTYQGFCERLSDWQELARSLDVEIALTTDEGYQADLRLRLSRLRLDQLGDIAGAIDLAAKVQEGHPGHAGIRAFAEGLFQAAVEPERSGGMLLAFAEATADYALYAKTIEIMAAGARDTAQRADMLSKAGDVCREHLNDPERAFMLYSSAFSAAPFRVELAEAAYALAGPVDGWEQVSMLLEEALPKVADAPAATPLNRMLAEIKLSRFNDGEGAEVHFRGLLHADLPKEEMLGVLEALTGIYRKGGRHQQLADVLRRKALLVEEAAGRAPLLREMARLQTTQLNDAAGAYETTRQLLQIDPDDRESLDRMVELASRLARWQDLGDALERLIKLGGEPRDLAELRFELGHLYEERFAEVDRGLDLFEKAAEEWPAMPVLRKHLEEMVKGGRHADRAAAILTRCLEAAGEWDRLVPLLEAAAGGAATPQKAAEYLVRIADIQLTKLGQADMALLVLCRVLREDPEHADVPAKLEHLAGELGSFEEVAMSLQEAIEQKGLSDRARRELALRLATMYDEKLAEPDAAMPHYETVFSLDPENTHALIALDRLYRLRGEWQKLTEVLEAEIHAASDQEERLNLIYRLAKLWEEKLDEADGAIICYRRLTDVRPDHKMALKALEKLYERKKDWVNLSEILEREIAIAEDPEDKRRIKGRLAEVSAWKLGKIDDAIAHWRESLDSDPASDEAYGALERIFETQENWQAVADLMREFAPRLLDRRKALGIYQKLGQLTGTKLNDAARAREAFQEALAIDPKDPATLDALKALYRSEGSWEELITILRKMIPLQDDPRDMKTLRLELMETLGLKLGRRDDALDAAKRALDIEPHEGPDLDRIGATLETLLAWDDLARVLGYKLGTIPEEDATAVERAALMLRIAGLYRVELNDPVSATEYFEHAHEIDPGHRGTYDALKDLYVAQGEWRKLVTLHDTAVAQAHEPAARAELLKQIADVYEQKLHQPDMAFMTWCRIYREDYHDMAALTVVEKLAHETGSFEELHGLYEEAAEQVKDPQVLVDLHHRSARVTGEHLGEGDQAEGHLRQILEIDPRNMEAVDALAATYEKAGKWVDLVDILDSKVPLVDSVEEKVGLRIRIGEIWEQRLGKVEEAITSFRRGLELDGRDPRVLEALAAIHLGERRFADLLPILRRQVEAAPDKDAARDVRLKIAALLDREMSEPDKAIAEYRGVIEDDEACIDAYKALDEIFTRTERWEDLVEVFEQRIPVEPDPVEAALLHSKAAGLYEERFSDLRKASQHLEDLLVLSPGELSAVKGLERIYETGEDWEKLVDTQQRHLELADDAAEQVAVLQQMAEVYYGRLQLTDRAEEVYNQVLKVEPQNIAAIHALAQMYERSGNWFNAMEMLQREAEVAGGGPEAIDLWYRMGKINEDMLLDPGSAKECYQKALDIEPSHLPSIRALKVIYSIEKDLDLYIKAMLDEAQYTEEPAEKTRLFYEVGRIYEEEKNDPRSAARYYEESLKVTPTFLPAAKILADIYFKEEDWPRAEACTEIVVDEMDRATAGKELSRLYYRLGYITEKMKDNQKALRHYQTSYEIDSTYLPVLEGLANCLVSSERWDDAVKVYQKVLVHHKDDLSEAEIADLYFQIGSLSAKLGQDDRAIKSFEKVIQIDDKHQRAIEALLETREGRGEHEEAYDLVLQLIGIVEGARRFELYMRLGALCRDKLEDSYRALDAFQGAMRCVAEGPGQLPAMAELYGQYRATKQAQKAAGLLEQMVQLEDDPGRLTSYWFDLAEIRRADLGEPDKAVEAYNKVLDIDPAQSKAFIAIEGLLAERKDWRALESSYRAMIQRTPKESKEKRLVLWKSLGELYHRALRDPDAAIMAYEVVAGYEKESVEVLETLAELYTGKEKHREKAVKTHHTVLRLTTTPVKSCRALKRLYLASRDYDKVYNVCAVLRYLKQSDAEDEKILSQLRPRLKELANRATTDQHWESVIIHHQAKSAVNPVLVFLRRRMPDVFAQNVEDLGVKKKDAIDVAQSQLFFVNMFKYVTRVLNVGDFALYRAPAGVTGLRIVNTSPLSLVAGEDMFRDRPKKETFFALARELSLARPEFILPATLGAEDFQAVFSAAVSFINPVFAHEGNTELIERWRRKMAKYLTDDQVTALRAIVSGYLQEKHATRLTDWLEGIEFTTARAGFALAGDLDLVMGLLQSAPGRLARPPFRTVVREMIMYAVSEEYLALREKLGLAIQV